MSENAREPASHAEVVAPLRVAFGSRGTHRVAGLPQRSGVDFADNPERVRRVPRVVSRVDDDDLPVKGGAVGGDGPQYDYERGSEERRHEEE